MPSIQSLLLWALLALLLVVVSVQPFPEWIDDLVLAGYVLLFQ
jgi:hypothetical protein